MIEKEQLLLYEYTINNELGTIYAPKVKEIARMSMMEFNKLLMPFLFQLKDFSIPKEYEDQVTVFDVILLSGQDIKEALKISLSFFYKTNDISIDKDNGKVYLNKNSRENEVIIDKDNFEILSETILKLCMISKREDEEETKLEYKTEQGKEALLELMKLRRQHEEVTNKAISLFQLISVVVHGMGWLYKDVLDLTYAQLINSYRCVMQIDNYQVMMDYKTSGQFEIKDEVKHWSHLIEE